jgi:crossover junction endodeoxyribonuclease RusA
MDIDNLPKPILDALKGLVYLDDTQITDVVCRKRNLHSDLRVEILQAC